VAFVSLRDNFELGTRSGRLLFQIIAAMAEFERTLMPERPRAGAFGNAKKEGLAPRDASRPLMSALRRSWGADGKRLRTQQSVPLARKDDRLYRTKSSPALLEPFTRKDSALSILRASDKALTLFGSCWGPAPQEQPWSTLHLAAC
jgi:Resolvase, N terminal domain